MEKQNNIETSAKKEGVFEETLKAQEKFKDVKSQEQYQPTKEEIEESENIMTDDKREMSHDREKSFEIKEDEKIFNSSIYNVGVDYINDKISLDESKKKVKEQFFKNQLPVDDNKGNKEKREKWLRVEEIFDISKLFMNINFDNKGDEIDFENYIKELKNALKGKKILEIGPGGEGGQILSLKKFMGEEIEATIIERGGTIYSQDKGYLEKEYKKLFEDNNINVILSESPSGKKLEDEGSFDVIICQRVFYDGDCGSMLGYTEKVFNLFEFYNSFLKKGGLGVYSGVPFNYDKYDLNATTRRPDYSKEGKFEIRNGDQKYKIAHFGWAGPILSNLIIKY